MTTEELLDQEKFKLSEIEREIASHAEQGKGLDQYAAHLQAEWKKLTEETLPAFQKRAAELHNAQQQSVGAIAMLEKLAEQTQTASA